jgi:Cytosol aminopeptidase family, N-terminal domain
MSRTARVSSIKEGLALPTIAVPVVVREGAGSIDDAIVQSGVSVPGSLSVDWCRQQGLKGDVGSAVVLRSLNGANIVLVSLGADQSTTNYRLAGAAAARAAGEGSFAFLLPRRDWPIRPMSLSRLSKARSFRHTPTKTRSRLPASTSCPSGYRCRPWQCTTR